MKVTVFGASGRTGRIVVDLLLERGHEVTAYVRDPARLGRQHAALSVVQGSASEPASIAKAVAGADCIISAMASGRGILTELARHLVPVLLANGPRRIVTLGGAGAALPGDPRSLKRRFYVFMMELGVAYLMDDMRAHWAALNAARLECTLVRPPRLTNGPATGRLKHGPDIALSLMDSISRTDLAAFMIDIALDGRYVGQAPFVARA